MRSLNPAGARFAPRPAHRPFSAELGTGHALTGGAGAVETPGNVETPDNTVSGLLPATLRRTAMELFQLATRLENDRVRPAPPVGPGLGLVPVTVDVDAFKAWVAGDPVTLTHQEFRLLQELVAHAGHVRTREQLVRKAWARPGDGSGRTVDVHVRRLRVALGPAAARVSTVRNVGYRFD